MSAMAGASATSPAGASPAARAPAALAPVWRALSSIPDPEIPVLSIVDLGIVRAVEREGEGVVVRVTPTYGGGQGRGVEKGAVPKQVIRFLNDEKNRSLRV